MLSWPNIFTHKKGPRSHKFTEVEEVRHIILSIRWSYATHNILHTYMHTQTEPHRSQFHCGGWSYAHTFIPVDEVMPPIMVCIHIFTFKQGHRGHNFIEVDEVMHITPSQWMRLCHPSCTAYIYSHASGATQVIMPLRWIKLCTEFHSSPWSYAAYN